jgi:hypothetical protein
MAIPSLETNRAIIEKGGGFIAAVCWLLIAFVTVTDVLGRYLFSAPMPEQANGSRAEYLSQPFQYGDLIRAVEDLLRD